MGDHTHVSPSDVYGGADKVLSVASVLKMEPGDERASRQSPADEVSNGVGVEVGLPRFGCEVHDVLRGQLGLGGVQT